MPLAGFEPAIAAIERPQTCAVHRAATGIGWEVISLNVLQAGAGTNVCL